MSPDAREIENWNTKSNADGSWEVPHYDIPSNLVKGIEMQCLTDVIFLTTYTHNPEGGFKWRVPMKDLGDDRIVLTAPLEIIVEFWGKTVIAYNFDLDQFGYGDSENEAFESLRNCISDLYFILKEEGESNLGPIPLRHWRYLKSIVKEL